jgi:galactokinase
LEFEISLNFEFWSLEFNLPARREIRCLLHSRFYLALMSLQSMAEHCSRLFTRCFGDEPQWLVAAPGRVNLIGEHTDYNDGFVLPMAIERFTMFTAGPAPEGLITLHSLTTGETARFSLRPRVERGDPSWSNYVRGVIAGFQKARYKVQGFNAVIDSSVPFGGGLSSSAALEVAAATLLETMCSQSMDPVEKALLCQKAEHEFAGVPCGIMDQFTSVLARENHAILLDCRSCKARPVPMTSPLVTVLIINTNVRHKLADGEYAKRRAQCESAARTLGVRALRDASLAGLKLACDRMDPVAFRRARHVIAENDRTRKAARALETGDWPRMGELMYASHASLRDDYEVSCRELDTVVEIAQSIGETEGVIGCRMTGAGFGGCAVSLVKTEAVPHIIRKVGETYERKTGTQASIFSTRPAAGARVLS